MEDPGEHGRRCGLAMRSGYDQDLLASEELVMQQVRKRAERNSLVQNVFEFDVSARHCIADHDQIGPGFEVLCVERLRYWDAQIMEKIRHRGIRGGVRARDLKAALL